MFVHTRKILREFFHGSLIKRTVRFLIKIVDANTISAINISRIMIEY